MKKIKLPPLIVGWQEWVSLPDLNIEKIKVKMDTGARTSALHAENIQTRHYKSGEWAYFDVFPLLHDKHSVSCRAPIIDERPVRSSSGHAEHRIVIVSLLKMGDREKHIQITLTNRDQMRFRMLLGREALTDVLVNSKKRLLLTDE